MKRPKRTVKTSDKAKQATTTPPNKSNTTRVRARGTPAKPDSKAPTSWHAPFLEILRKDGRVYRACDAVGVDRTTAYAHKKAFTDFSQAWDAVVDRFMDDADAELYRRAVKGYLKPVYQGGKKVGEVQEYSDELLKFLMTGRRRDVYGNHLKISGELKTPPPKEEIEKRGARFEAGIIATIRAAALSGKAERN